jgi:probable F420-dependent oxidoreductase
MTVKFGIGLFTGQIPSGSHRTFHQDYHDSIELVKLAEDEGFDAAWLSEHHFSADGYLPSLLVLMAAFAAATERIELGTGVILAPFHDPIRLAEDFAVVDQLAGGRTIAGFALGWRDEEFREFGIEVSSRVRRTIELIDVLRLAWSQERFSYDGNHYSYDQVAVTPKPARVPPILVGGFSDPAVKRAGRVGDGFISSRVPLERLEESLAMAAQARKEAGQDGEPVVGVLQNAFVTEDPEGDWPAVRDGIGHQLGTYAGWRNSTDVPGTPMEVSPPDEDDIRSSTAYGTPEQVIESLAPLVEVLARYESAHLVVRLYYPGMEGAQSRRAVELFGREVAPHFR